MAIIVRAMGPLPEWAETRLRDSGARLLRPRGRARPRPLRPRGAQQRADHPRIGAFSRSLAVLPLGRFSSGSTDLGACSA